MQEYFYCNLSWNITVEWLALCQWLLFSLKVINEHWISTLHICYCIYERLIKSRWTFWHGNSLFVNYFMQYNLGINRIVRNKRLGSGGLKCLLFFCQNNIGVCYLGIFLLYFVTQLLMWFTHFCLLIYCFCYLNFQAKPFKGKWRKHQCLCLWRNTEVIKLLRKREGERCWVVVDDSVSCFELSLVDTGSVDVLEVWKLSAHPVCAVSRYISCSSCQLWIKYEKCSLTR